MFILNYREKVLEAAQVSLSNSRAQADRCKSDHGDHCGQVENLLILCYGPVNGKWDEILHIHNRFAIHTLKNRFLYLCIVFYHCSFMIIKILIIFIMNVCIQVSHHKMVDMTVLTKFFQSVCLLCLLLLLLFIL